MDLTNRGCDAQLAKLPVSVGEDELVNQKRENGVDEDAENIERCSDHKLGVPEE